MTFAQTISTLPRDHIVIGSPSGNRTVGQLLDYSSVHGCKLRGGRLALNLADPVAGVEALVAADGQAESITLLPPTLSDHHLSALIEKADCDLLLASERQTPANLPDISVSSSLDDLNRHPETDTGRTRETAWHLATSGTTNVPKLVAHTFSSLSRTVKRKPISSDAAYWGLLYDYMRFAGLQVVLQLVRNQITLLI